MNKIKGKTLTRFMKIAEYWDRKLRPVNSGFLTIEIFSDGSGNIAHERTDWASSPYKDFMGDEELNRVLDELEIEFGMNHEN